MILHIDMVKVYYLNNISIMQESLHYKMVNMELSIIKQFLQLLLEILEEMGQ